jgi:PAS domain S-box-containing protein
VDHLADLVETHHDTLLQRWSAALAQGRHTGAELTDHLPAFLRQIIATLRAPAGLAGAPPSGVGAAFGAPRFRPGFAIEAVAREYGLLLHLVLEVVELTGAPVSIRAVRRLGDLVTDAIAEATAEYTRRITGALAGRVTSVFPPSFDAAEGHQRDAELRIFRAVVDASTDFIAFGKPGGRPDYVNPAGLRLVGLASQEAARALTVAEYYMPATRDAMLARMMPLIRAGLPFQGETELRHFGTGEAIPVSQAAFAVNDASGQPIVLAAVLRDRREQQRAVETLHRSEENFRMLSEAIPQQVWSALPDGALDFVNQRVLDYFATSRAQGIGAGWLSVIHPEDVMDSIERWARSLATGAEYEVEFRLRRADGTYRWHLGRALAARDDRGQIVKWFGTNTDIDEAKKGREELEKRTEFEKHLLGIVSHDLRNPLGAILLGATGLLELDESEWVTKIAQRIHSSAERSTRMISDLLDFTQARLGGGIRLERRPTDLYALARTTIDEVEAAYPDRTVALLSRAGDTHGTWDADRIVQVVTNLVTNALKYSQAGTPVVVRATGQEGAAELAIHNQGPPIPPERLGRIFEPLQRASDQIDLKTRSVGLGLYIVDAIVQAHGGTVGVVSTAEAGTTFTVRLPRAPVTAALFGQA